MTAPFTDTFAARMSAAKQALCFGEVAMALNLKGSSRTGWDCPACGSRGTLNERPDRKGARCSLPGCNKGFDAPGLVITARGVSAPTALAFLERVIAEREAKGNAKAPGLFDQGEA
jgi:hypothetical protein